MFRYLFPIIFLWTCTGCNDVFDITPYDTPSGSDATGLTERNITEWKERSAGFEGPVTIALISDPHYYYGDLADIIDRVNVDPSVEVVIVPGDLTDQGLLGEFQLFTNVMARCQHPWLATIGNHDHLRNGRQIYEQMFGPRNFHVDLRGHRFIFFDNTVWESALPPDLGWLQQTLASSGDLRPVLIAHIPKHDEQLENGYGSSIVQLLEEYGSKLFLAGHVHGFSDRYEQDIHYVTIPWPRERHYVKVILDEDEVEVQLIGL